jgi:hypothetical protein
MWPAPTTSPVPGQSIKSFVTWMLCVITCPHETEAGFFASAELAPTVDSTTATAAGTMTRKTEVMCPPFVVP